MLTKINRNGVFNSYSYKISQNTPTENKTSLSLAEIISFQGAMSLKAAALSKVSFKGNEIINGLFQDVSANENNPKWQDYVSRKSELYRKEGEYRSEFERDYDRILKSSAFSRLKGKAQVFISPDDDHTCTRIEHVLEVARVSRYISKNLGLNPDLAESIALGHDLGHSPFGHVGETILKNIMKDNNMDGTFWHEKNGLRFVDIFETLTNRHGAEKTLNLTYAVRDGIICHCGEVDQNVLRPRDEFIDLESIDKPNQYAPYSWEGCVVKIADKIAYLGRDIQDALNNKILPAEKKGELRKIAEKCLGEKVDDVNSSLLIDGFIKDLCRHSTPEKGLTFSKEYLELMKAVKDFNYTNICSSPRNKIQDKYANTIITSIFEDLRDNYKGRKTISELKKTHRSGSILVESFGEWLNKYSDLNPEARKNSDIPIVYSIDNKQDYMRAIIDFISSRTDNFAIKAHKEIISF